MLSVERVTRAYGERRVLDEVSFEVRPGRMTGFVGANGAGKTTTMRIIVGTLSASAGRVTWDGAPLRGDLRRSFGYMPEERGLYPKMSSIDQLVFFGRLHGMSAGAARTRAGALLERLGLADRCDDQLEKLSLGNQQRVQVAAAVLHHPPALILDEPFSGLDPLAMDVMVALLREEMTHATPVLFSSHQLELVERLCDDLVILADGRVVAAGSVEQLRSTGEPRYRVTLVEGSDPARLQNLEGVAVVSIDGPVVVLAAGACPPQQLLAALMATGVEVAEFTKVVRPLSEIYREAVR